MLERLGVEAVGGAGLLVRNGVGAYVGLLVVEVRGATLAT